MSAAHTARKQLGAWFTPAALIDIVLDGVIADFTNAAGALRRPVRVLDPSCGDARFLLAAGEHLAACGYAVELVGCDIDAAALESIDGSRVTTINADALTYPWVDGEFDIVVGNPPFLSQMSAATTRGRSSRHGGGPYADAAVEFLALAVRVADPHHGCVGLVLPQSILGSRDAEQVRRSIGQLATRSWSWWEPRQSHFDAAVNVCALGFRRPAQPTTSRWTEVVTERLGVPRFDTSDLAFAGTLADRAELNANFRDEYYALVPAVREGGKGPPLVTSGLIDPGACHWGTRPVTFAKRRWNAPTVDVSQLHGRFQRWAERKLVPKVLVANQTRMIEAVADHAGAWLPGVPVTTVTPLARQSVAELAAVLTSPVATALAWHSQAGTGLTTTSIRIGPASLAAIDWPAGDLRAAVAALAQGDVRACGRLVGEAYSLPSDVLATLYAWWTDLLPPGAS